MADNPIDNIKRAQALSEESRAEFARAHVDGMASLRDGDLARLSTAIEQESAAMTKHHDAVEMLREVTDASGNGDPEA
jgi:hypothetical protein